MYLLVALFFFLLLFFFPGKEGLGTTADLELPVKMNSKDLVNRIQLNTNVVSGDAWINLLDITIRNNKGEIVDYGQPVSVYFGNRGNWGGQPVQNLWDDETGRRPEHRTMSHSSREAENLVIKLEKEIELGSIQITNRHDCCWHRIANYRLAVYNKGNEALAEVSLAELAHQGRTIKYNFNSD